MWKIKEWLDRIGDYLLSSLGAMITTVIWYRHVAQSLATKSSVFLFEFLSEKVKSSHALWRAMKPRVRQIESALTAFAACNAVQKTLRFNHCVREYTRLLR